MDGLLDAGWQQVVVVTDHGWLYVPGGLPKVELPYYLTKDERMKKGRTGGSLMVPLRRVTPSLVLGSRGADGRRTRDRDVRGRALSTSTAASALRSVLLRSLRSAIRDAPKGPVTLAVDWRGLRADVSFAG